MNPTCFIEINHHTCIYIVNLAIDDVTQCCTSIQSNMHQLAINPKKDLIKLQFGSRYTRIRLALANM